MDENGQTVLFDHAMGMSGYVWFWTASNMKSFSLSNSNHSRKDRNLHIRVLANIIGPRREKTCLRGFANNTGADQPAHPRRLISASVIHLSKRIISRLATSEISIV